MYIKKIKNKISDFIGVKNTRKLVRTWLKIKSHLLGKPYRVDYSSLDSKSESKLIKVQEMVKLFSDSEYKEVYSKEEVKYWEHIVEWISKDPNKSNVKSVLDIGCAFGTLAYFSKLIYNCDAYAFDAQDRVRLPQINFKQMNIEFDNLPNSFPKKYDRIIFTEILEHLRYHPVPTLKKINNWLNKNGILYISTPMAEDWGKLNYYNKISNIPYPSKNKDNFIDKHIYQYNEKELFEVLELANFKVIEVKYSEGALGRRHFNLKVVKNN